MEPTTARKRPGAPGASDEDSVKGAGLKRLAPESSGLLKDIDGALKQKPKQQSKEEKMRAILKKCRCM